MNEYTLCNKNRTYTEFRRGAQSYTEDLDLKMLRTIGGCSYAGAEYLRDVPYIRYL
jgi:hypothetical protein